MAFPGRADVPIVVSTGATDAELLAAQDLSQSLHRLYPGESFPLAKTLLTDGKCILVGSVTSEGPVRLRVQRADLHGPEGYRVTTLREGTLELGVVAGSDARGTVYGVYALLQHLGFGFQLDGDTVPDVINGPFRFDAWQLADRPLVRDRLVFNWHNFLSGCSTWNLEDWRRWITQSLKLGYNAVMVHAYGNNPMVSFSFNGKTKPVGYLSTTVKGRDWSTMHVNDVRRLHGGHVFDQAVFGADAALVPEEERTDAARRLMRKVSNHAEQRGMDLFFAIDIDTTSANPQELIRTLPESARFPVDMQEMGWMGQEAGRFWLANPDTPEGYAFYRIQVETLLSDYPSIDTLVAWFRRGNTPWVGFAVDEMPPAWQEEYRAELAKTPEAGTYWHGPNIFAMAKIVKAFQRALRETGHEHVKVAFGTWDFTFLPAANRYLPADVICIGLDYSVLHDQPILEGVDGRQWLRQVGLERPLIPVVWAHHDDGNYVGRPYTPPARFHEKLTDAAAGGYGIIHWTTRPLDLYFASLSRQVWARTENEPLAMTCRALADRWFQPEGGDVMGGYLEQWVTSAPKFGRETTDWFIDRPLEDKEAVIAGCEERLRLIDAVAEDGLPSAVRERLNYFRGLERFIMAFYRNQQHFENAQAAWEKRDLATARQSILRCDPAGVIEQFARFSSFGGISRGEQGLVVTLNTRWLTHIIRLRQALGLEAVRLNFAPTSHDPLAQSAGRYTFHFDPDQTVWDCRGKTETGAKVFAWGESTELILPETVPESWDEIYATGISSASPLRVALPEVAAGDYRVRVLLRDSLATGPGQNVFDLRVNHRIQGRTWSFAPVTNAFWRIVCRGNSENSWNSLREVWIGGVPGVGAFRGVSASAAEEGHEAENAFDGDPKTRWAADGKGAWLQFRLEPGRVVTEIGLDWYKGSDRAYDFELLTSPDGRTWTPVLDRQSGSVASLLAERIDVRALAGGVNEGADFSRWLRLDTAGTVELSLRPVEGRAFLCGVVLEPGR